MAKISTNIFKQEAKFVAGVAKIKQFPKLFLPQIAFIGKSNVGKSSLINTICKRKALARVSHTPGRTQQINFFSIAEKLLIADLPGYGFAKVSRNLRNQWNELIYYYLKENEKLALVNVLVDARRGLKPNDIEVIELLDELQCSYQIIFTKADKVKNIEEFKKITEQEFAERGIGCKYIITSSKNALGYKELQLSVVESI